MGCSLGLIMAFCKGMKFSQHVRKWRRLQTACMTPCTKWQERHKLHNSQQGCVLEMQHKLQVAQRGAEKGSGIRTHPRTKESQWKKNCGMLPKSNVLTMRSWDTLPRTMKW
jgi:hypothetical protein